MCRLIISVLCITTVICKTYNDDDYDHVTDHLPFSSDKVEVAMKLYKVIPDVIKFVPDLNLKVKFRNRAVLGGNIIMPSRAKYRPKIYWDERSRERLYTISMIDADYEDRPNAKYREWKNWLVVNVPGNNIKKGKTLAEYVPPIPAKGTGYHRYVVLVYGQKREIQFKEFILTNRSDPNYRGNFSISRFAIKYNLGNPLAGNFFRSSFDKYVLKVHKYLNTSYEDPSLYDFDEEKYKYL